MITVSELTFTYPRAQAPAIVDLTFDVNDGEVFGFLGPSGAGKSTTQNVLIGLLRGWRGVVDVMGRALGEWDSSYYREIGVSFESPNHYLKLTARENLEYFRALYGGKALAAAEVLEMVGLSDDIDKPVSDFSKGMKNRLNFARSLLHQPRLWFLDEPTAGLDPVNAVRIREVIRQHAERGVTALVTTHDMHTAAQVCDRVAFIVDGRIAAVGEPAELCRRYGKREVEVTWCEHEDQTCRASFPFDEIAENIEFLEALRHPNVIAVHSQEATLEDVFVEITGRSLS